MKIPVKKLNTGFTIPVLGMGTWEMGGGHWYEDSRNDEKYINALKTGIKMGFRHIDTAEMYGAGHAEELVSQAISEFPRKDLFITSKVWPSHLQYQDVINSCHASLNRLKTDYLDLYLIHSPNPNIEIETPIAAMNELLEDGLIKNIGVSNFGVREFKEAQSVSAAKLVANQVEYNLLYRAPEQNGVLQYCQENDVILTAWEPLAKGAAVNSSNNLLTDMETKYEKTKPQIAINWLISQKNVIAIPKMGDISHIKENLGGIGWNMDIKDFDKLTNEFF